VSKLYSQAAQVQFYNELVASLELRCGSVHIREEKKRVLISTDAGSAWEPILLLTHGLFR
jgi:hypothetical protein